MGPPVAPVKKAKNVPQKAALGRPKKLKPSEDNKSHTRAVWSTTDHDYLKTKSEPGCMTEKEALRQENAKLKKDLLAAQECNLRLETLRDEEFPIWTNLPSREVFLALAEYVEERGAGELKMWRGANTTKHEHFTEAGFTTKPGPDRVNTVQQELFLVLLKLKTGFDNQHLERFFKITDTSISQIFTTYINFLAVELRHLFEMPENVEDPQTFPDCFKPYPDLKTIIDCTEVFVEKANNLQARKQMYSNYKGHETIKFLVGMSPHLFVNYVSSAWGGRASDKHITLASQALLDGLPRGSAVMTDRGFNVNEDFEARGVQLIIPDFKGRGRSQISRAELASSEKTAESRIHIERIIQRIRTFHILSQRVKLSMQDILEQVFVCCAYLTNFQPSIIHY